MTTKLTTQIPKTIPEITPNQLILDIIAMPEGTYKISTGNGYLSAHWVGFAKPELKIKVVDNEYLTCLDSTDRFKTIEDVTFIAAEYIKQQGGTNPKIRDLQIAQLT